VTDGPEELALIERTGWRAWPPRLPDQLYRYDVHQVGGSRSWSTWIPAKDLEELNANIVGRIEVVEEFRPTA
jgi:hypothetical protein